jgi:hypothetical protein
VPRALRAAASPPRADGPRADGEGGALGGGSGVGGGGEGGTLGDGAAPELLEVGGFVEIEMEGVGGGK